jgi:hypothetical protein
VRALVPVLDKAHDLVRKKSVDSAALDKRANAGGWSYPPSFRRALAEYGLFTLGKVTAATDHLCFVVWPPKEHKPALEVLAEQLGCDAVPATVAEELGIDEADVAALAKLIVVGCEGHEDFCAFDVRTRNDKTGECSFRLVLFDDLEIADAAKPGKTCTGDGFDTWLARHVVRRAENAEPVVEVEPEAVTPPSKPAPKRAPKPLRSFAKLGAFTTVPLADVTKRIAKLLAPAKLGTDIYWNEGELPEVAFVHRGAIRGSELKLGGAEAGIYVIEGDLASTGYLDLDLDEDVIVLVAGNVKAPYLRISFATTLLVEGSLTAEWVVSEALTRVAVAGTTKAKGVCVYDDDVPHGFGKQPKGVVLRGDALDRRTGDKDELRYDAPVLFRKMITGKKFLR